MSFSEMTHYDPIVSQSNEKQAHAAWMLNLQVQSAPAVAGRIAATPEDLEMLHDGRLLDVPYQTATRATPLYQATESGRSALRTFVEADAARCGLRGQIAMRTIAGDYQEAVNGEPWHVDMYGRATMRWTVARGIGPTLLAAGTICQNDFVAGNLKAEIGVGPGGDLLPIIPEDGEVSRFSCITGVHAGPQGNGPRILHVATMRLK